jgi:hypothetical protein
MPQDEEEFDELNQAIAQINHLLSHNNYYGHYERFEKWRLFNSGLMLAEFARLDTVKITKLNETLSHLTNTKAELMEFGITEPVVSMLEEKVRDLAYKIEERMVQNDTSFQSRTP